MEYLTKEVVANATPAHKEVNWLNYLIKVLLKVNLREGGLGLLTYLIP